MTSRYYDAILLVAFGGPSAAEEIRPFLERVTEGIRIPAERIEEVAHHYEAVGGKSPLNEITYRQAAALQTALSALNIQTPVYVGFRNVDPFFVDTLKQIRDAGGRRVLGFILSSHQTEASWERYQKNIADARAAIGEQAAQVDYCAGWHDHPLFVQSWTERIEAIFSQLPIERRHSTPIVFSAHSLPVAMAARSPYEAQLRDTARLIAKSLNSSQWLIAYQSRSGRPTDPWLEPDIENIIRKLAAEGHNAVVVAPIGFVSDHVEVLYDLDIEARKIAEDLRMQFHRVACPNDDPTFIRMIADVIAQQLNRSEDRR
ncbi:MAG TPA: ferrochelatase [Candidatus Binatia bacterium]